MTIAAPPVDDIAALATGGRTNVIGFWLRLAARIPFLFIAGRVYGPEDLGRMAYAILIVEFAAQLATMGLRRGLALQLSRDDSIATHEVWDALLTVFIVSIPATILLILLPKTMFPNSAVEGFESLLPLAIFPIAAADVMLAALAYRYDIKASVRARAIIEPWTISIGAGLFALVSLRHGLLMAYGLSIAAAFFAAMVPFVRSYGLPWGWRPAPVRVITLARRNLPIAGAEAIEWATRRIDLAILGLFVSPATVGIYYVAQQITSLPQKLKTSFDPVLGPVIARKLEAGDKAAVAKQISQVGFWILAAQAGGALSLGLPGQGVLGIVGPNFPLGNGALAFLLLAEVAAAAAVVSEAALIYIASWRNLFVSLVMIAVQAALSFALILSIRSYGYNEYYQAVGPAAALAIAMAIGSMIKTRLAGHLLGSTVAVWRWPLIFATVAAGIVGGISTLGPEWVEIIIGIPLILITYGWIIWNKGFGEEDRVLFKKAV
ncbi:MAG: lipopolysaccharide biosynthesis protein [Sphingomonadaceae bacterium]